MSYIRYERAVSGATIDPDSIRASLRANPRGHGQSIWLYIGAAVLQRFGMCKASQVEVLFGDDDDAGKIKLRRPYIDSCRHFRLSIRKSGTGIVVIGVYPEWIMRCALPKAARYEILRPLGNGQAVELLIDLRPLRTDGLEADAAADAAAMEAALAEAAS